MKEVQLTKGGVALVDDEDYERVMQFRWSLLPVTNRSKPIYYAKRGTMRGGVQKSILMHRFILDAPKGIQVDHINGDGLDNRRANLRLATNSQNHCNIGKPRTNSTGYKGVGLTAEGRYQARLKHHGKHVCVGTFGTAEEAARAYDAKALELFGEFARPNFPQE